MKEVPELSHAERFPYVALLIALVIGFLSILPYFGLRFDHMPGDLWDNRLSNYLLEHGYKWITGQTPGSFFDAPFFFPARASIRYSENFLGGLPFYIPWRLVGFDRENAFQIWILLGYLINYLAAAWVLKKLQFHWFAVLAGAYMFAFSQVALTHSAHIQLHYRFGIPLAWYFLHLFLEDFRPKHLLISLAFLGWQFYCNIYEGYFLGLFLAAFVLVSLCTKPVIRRYFHSVAIQSAAAHILVVIGFAVALWPLASGYARSVTDPQLMAARRAEIITMLPRPISYFVGYTGNTEAGWYFDRVDLPMKHEHTMFVGLIPWIAVLTLVITAGRPGRHPEVMPTIVAMFLVVGATLYLNGYSFYFVLMKLPGVNGMRAVTRVIMILLLPFAIATAQVLHLCYQRVRSSGSSVLTAFVILVATSLAVENRMAPYRYLKQEARDRAQNIAAQLPTQLPNNAVLAYLYPVDGASQEGSSQLHEIDAMLAAQAMNIATMNGYSGSEPDGFRQLHSCADMKLALDEIILRNESFSVQDPASQIVAVGMPVDGPCGIELARQASRTTEPLSPAAFRANIEVTAPATVAANANFLAQVRVTNQSDVLWRAKGFPSGKFGMRVSCQWLTSGSKVMKEYPNRFDFPYDVPPHETVLIPAVLTAPEGSGAYTIECDAVQELVNWFHTAGSATGKAQLKVPRDPKTPAIRGTLDLVDTDQIAGWAWNEDQPEAALQIEIRADDTGLTTAIADRFRQDLLDAGIGTGVHAFSIPNPLQVRDGKPRSIHAFVAGTNTELGSSPRTFTPGR